MLTKKEKLLDYPWIVQRYRNHRKKVHSATSAIDFRCPSAHVSKFNAVQSKKQQKEEERRKAIEKENIRLLQKLGTIMNESRLNNFWRAPRPNFLNREFIYKPQSKPPRKFEDDFDFQFDEDEISFFKGGSYRKCLACNKSKKRPKSNQIQPEGRIPWAPTKKSWNKNILNEEFNKLHIVCCRC